MAFQLRLICGRRSLNLLSSDGWKVQEGGAGFSEASGNYVFGSANARKGGKRRTSSSYDNNEIPIGLRLTNQSGMSVLQRVDHDLRLFFLEAKKNQENGNRDAVYLERIMDEGYSGTGEKVVLYGRGPLYYQILAGRLETPSEAYSRPALGSSKPSVPSLTLTLTCYPFAMGKPQMLAESTGWIEYDNDGNLHIWEGTTNLAKNPGHEDTVTSFDVSWFPSGSDIDMEIEYEHVHRQRGSKTFVSARVYNLSSSVSQAYTIDTGNLTASLTYQLTDYVRVDGGSVGSDAVTLYAAGSISTTYTEDSLNPGWYRMSGSVTGLATASDCGFWLKGGKRIYEDNFQVEQKTYNPTPFAQGAQGVGLNYSGTYDNSATIRTAGRLRVPVKVDNIAGFESINFSKGMLSTWVKADLWTVDDAKAHVLMDTDGQADTQNRITLWKDTGGNLVFRMYGNVTGGSKSLQGLVTGSWVSGSWYHIYAAWDISGPSSLYFNGSALATSTCTGIWTQLNQLGSYMHIGASAGGTNYFNGWIGDYRIFGPDAVTCASLLLAEGRGKTELASLWTWTIGGSVHTAVSTCTPNQKNYFYITGIPGDVEAPLRIFMYDTSGSYANTRLGWRHGEQYPVVMDTTEAEDGSNSPAASWTNTGDATRSGSSYMRFNSSVTGSGYLDLFSGITEKFMDDHIGQVRLVAYCRTNANVNRVQVKGAMLGMKGTTVIEEGDYKSLTQKSFWEPVDLGTFAFPPIRSSDLFYGQGTMNLAASPATTHIRVYVNNTTACAVNFDIDYVVIMPVKNSLTLGSTMADYNVVIDNISVPPRNYLGTADASNYITVEPAYPIEMSGNWPVAMPNAWNLFLLSQGVRTGSDVVGSNMMRVVGQYQPFFRWSR